MSAAAIVGILVALVLIGAGIWYMVTQRRRTEHLRARYGPEYSRAVSAAGDQGRAEAELAKREQRVELLEIHALTTSQREEFTRQWQSVQTRFVDDPKGAVNEASGLVEDVMKTRGYPVSTFDQEAADLSVHHARVVDNYRAARDIAIRHRQGKATTEDLRKAMVYYRELFEDLLEDREHASERPVERVVAREERAVANDATPPVRPRDNRRGDIRPEP